MHFNKKWWVLTSGAKPLLACTSIKSDGLLFIEVHTRRGLTPLVKTHHFLLKCIKGEVLLH
jgi:hypothetical protein